MKTNLLTVDDALATLSHSSLPSLVVEGGGDVIVLRRLEKMVTEVEMSVLPVGGRDTVLAMFERRAELGDAKCVLFFVDQDLWVYSSVPEEYAHDDVLTTNGYSIENDMLIDGNLENLLTDEESVNYKEELSRFIDWFSNQVRLLMNDENAPLGAHPNHVLQQPAPDVEDPELRASIAGKYSVMVRGKSLFAIILRQLSHANRVSKYSYANLLELGATARGPNLLRIKEWISARLAAHSCV